MIGASFVATGTVTVTVVGDVELAVLTAFAVVSVVVADWLLSVPVTVAVPSGVPESVSAACPSTMVAELATDPALVVIASGSPLGKLPEEKLVPPESCRMLAMTVAVAPGTIELGAALRSSMR
jgi:hypothetical protein